MDADIIDDADDAENEQGEEVKDALADHVVSQMSADYEPYHDTNAGKWLDYYYDYIGENRSGREPKEEWRTKTYFKFTKVKILSAASQIITAANANTERVSTSARDGNTEAATKMKDALNEQCEHANTNEKICTSAMDMLMYGKFYIQAPSIVEQITKSWVAKQSPMAPFMNPLLAMTGRPPMPPTWEAKLSKNKWPSLFNRNIFEMYAHPYSSGPDDGEGIYHRALLSEYDLADLRDKDGFDKKAIDALIAAGPSSSVAVKDGADEKLSARGYSGGNRSGYDLHFYTGKIGGKMLRESGVRGFEKAFGYQEVWTWVIKHPIGNKTIKTVPSPMYGRSRPFYSGVFERIPYEADGVGVAENMKELAKILNGSIRLFMDAKKLSLPMLGVDKTKLALPGQTLKIKPLSVYQFKGNPKEALFPIGFPEISAAADGLMDMIELAERYADEITQIPKWTTGINSKMVNKTAKGLSMLMSSQNQLMQTAVANIDAVLLQIAHAFYDWNMEFNPNSKIKGDMDITINGLSAVMAKELMTQKLLQMISLVINPQVTQSPYALKMLRMVGDYQGIKDVDSVLPKPEDLEAFLKQKSAMEALERMKQASIPPGAAVPGEGGQPGPEQGNAPIMVPSQAMVAQGTAEGNSMGGGMTADGGGVTQG